MPCPYFEPCGRLEDGSWARPPRMPLGAAFRGVCRAPSGDGYLPDADTLYESCNVGYARRRCSHFPDSSPADAIRFAVSGDSPGLIRIQYVVEKDHSPVEHGVLEYAAGRFLDSACPDAVQRQARAFVEAHLEHAAA